MLLKMVEEKQCEAKRRKESTTLKLIETLRLRVQMSGEGNRDEEYNRERGRLPKG